VARRCTFTNELPRRCFSFLILWAARGQELEEAEEDVVEEDGDNALPDEEEEEEGEELIGDNMLQCVAVATLLSAAQESCKPRVSSLSLE
jgi:hypothetical protein